MDQLLNQIMTVLLRGPALVIDVSEVIGRDTSQTSAILDYYAGKGEMAKTARRFGSSPIYFLEKDRDLALNKLLSTLNGKEKAIIEKIKSLKVAKSEDLAPAERYIIMGLDDFIKKAIAKDSDSGQQIELVFYYKLSQEEVKTIIGGPSMSKNTKFRAAERQPTLQEDRGVKRANAPRDLEFMSKSNFIEPKKLG